MFAVEGDTARQLRETEDQIVDEFRFGQAEEQSWVTRL